MNKLSLPQLATPKVSIIWCSSCCTPWVGDLILAVEFEHVKFPEPSGWLRGPGRHGHTET